MVRVVGVDPGSASWDFVGMDEDGSFFLDHSIPTKQIQKHPELFLNLIETTDFDIMSAPSGFGLPLKKIEDLKEEDFFFALLKKNPEKGMIVGLGQILKILQEQKVNGYFLPSVKHLSTVPRHKKVNKIDLGTADKLCTVVVGIRNQMEDYNISCEESSFIMVEMGYGFNAVIAIENGQITDGIGGSQLMGFRAVGSIDAEIAYLMGKIKKKDVYRGGVSSIAGYFDMRAEELLLLSKKDRKTKLAMDAFYDNLIKSVYAISSSFSSRDAIKEILFAGRLAKIDALIQPLKEKLSFIAPTKVMRSYVSISKESAQGAAFIANGLSGGRFADIVDNLKIRESSGSILDDIYLPLEQRM
ncbi:MAG: DUF1464 family protein [Candidatus Lokiarchaeota archaeon]|nr:DUF1464 family protein [Candidatus Lokiarchaeota archaeon]